MVYAIEYCILPIEEKKFRIVNWGDKCKYVMQWKGNSNWILFLQSICHLLLARLNQVHGEFIFTQRHFLVADWRGGFFRQAVRGHNFVIDAVMLSRNGTVISHSDGQEVERKCHSFHFADFALQFDSNTFSISFSDGWRYKQVKNSEWSGEMGGFKLNIALN